MRSNFVYVFVCFVCSISLPKILWPIAHCFLSRLSVLYFVTLGIVTWSNNRTSSNVDVTYIFLDSISGCLRLNSRVLVFQISLITFIRSVPSQNLSDFYDRKGCSFRPLLSSKCLVTHLMSVFGSTPKIGSYQWLPINQNMFCDDTGMNCLGF